MTKPLWQQMYEKRNAIIRRWFNAQVSPLGWEAVHLGIKNYTGAFRETFKAKTYTRDRKVIGGGFEMPRHAIYVHKGVGRGYPIAVAGGKGMGITKTKAAEKLRDKGYNKTAIASTLATSLAGKDNKQRKPKPWFNPVIERNLPTLADEVARHDADIIADQIFIQ